MTLDEFQDLLDTYGGAPSGWPQDKRQAALSLLEIDSHAVLMHEEAMMLDGLLAGGDIPKPSAQAMENLFEDVARHAKAERNRDMEIAFDRPVEVEPRLRDRLIGFWARPSMVLSGSAVAGVVLGIWDTWLEPAQETFLFVEFVYSALPL
jgi:hypothetical protein